MYPSRNGGCNWCTKPEPRRVFAPRITGGKCSDMARILVVDDNTPLRDAICENLQAIGHETVAVSDGRHVDQVQRNAPVDLLITDLFMPDTDGLEVIAFFRQNFPTVPIIAISGGGSRGMVELLTVARRLGAHRTLLKPFGRDDLLTAVKELLGLSQDSSAG